MPEKFIEERFDKLSESVAAASEQVAEDRKERERVRVVEENRTRWWRRLTVVAAVGSVLGLFGVVGVNIALNQLASDRKQGQVSSCHAYNEGLAASVNKIADELIGFLVLLGEDRRTPGEEPRTAEQQAQIDAIIAAQSAEFESIRVQYRDCSPEGIEAFSEGTGGYLLTGAEP